MTETFGALLGQFRRRAGLSITRLAGQAGIDTSAASRLESGQRHPQQATVLALAAVLRCVPAERDRLLLAAGYAPLVLAELPELAEAVLDLADPSEAERPALVAELRESVRRAREAVA